MVLALDLAWQTPDEFLESLELRFVFVEIANAARTPDAHLDVRRDAALDEGLCGQGIHDRFGRLDVALEPGRFVFFSAGDDSCAHRVVLMCLVVACGCWSRDR